MWRLKRAFQPTHVPRGPTTATMTRHRRRRPFGQIAELLPHADVVTKLHASCFLCERPAHFTVRIAGGTAVTEVGGAAQYQPACRFHYAATHPEHASSSHAAAQRATAAVGDAVRTSGAASASRIWSHVSQPRGGSAAGDDTRGEGCVVGIGAGEGDVGGRGKGGGGTGGGGPIVAGEEGADGAVEGGRAEKNSNEGETEPTWDWENPCGRG